MTDSSPARPDDPRRHLLAAMSHELRTPLNLVIGFADALAQERPHPADQVTALARATLDAAHQLQAAIDMALDMTRLSLGLLELSRDVIDVASLLDASGQAVVSRAQAAAVRIEIAPPFPRLRLRGDERRLRQVLEHLLEQAIAETAPGGCVTLAGGCHGSGTLRLTVRETVGHASLGLELGAALARAHGGSLECLAGVATVTLPADRLIEPSLTDQLQDLS